MEDILLSALGAMVDRRPSDVKYPEARPKSRTKALITATADLEEHNLEEVTLYAQFGKARAKSKS